MKSISKNQIISNILIIAFILLVFLAGYLSHLFQKKTLNQSEIIADAKLFSEKELTFIKKITLKNKSGEFIFERSSEGTTSIWHMTEPKKLTANSAFVNKLFDSLNVIKTKNIFPEDKMNNSNFSLDKPTATLELLDQYNKVVTINVGIMNTIDNTTYLKVVGKNGIYHVEAPGISLENANVNDLSETKIFDFQLPQLAYFELHKTNQSPLKIKKIETNWFLNEVTPLNNKRVEDLINDLANLKSNFVFENPTEGLKKQLREFQNKTEYKIVAGKINGELQTYTIHAVNKNLIDVDLKNIPYYLVVLTNSNLYFLIKEENLFIVEAKEDIEKTLQIEY